MKTSIKKVKLWKCPNCNRQFEKKGQVHSCKSFPLELHFKNKKESEKLYKKFKAAVKTRVGSFKIESLECCIHFVSTFAFAAVKIFRDKIRIDFSINKKIKSKRFSHIVPMSSKSILYCVDVINEDELDEELLGWIQEAHDKREASKKQL